MAEDRRVRRTRHRLISAFNTLFHERRRTIGVRDIVARSGVARSTFYDHYSGADAVHLEALEMPLAILAGAAVGEADRAQLEMLMAHMWEFRAQAPGSLSGRMGERAARKLADMVAQRLDRQSAALRLPIPLAAAQLSEAMLAPVKAWLAGAAPCKPERMAASLAESGERLVAALRAG